MSTNTGAPFSLTLPDDTDYVDLVGTFLKPPLQTLNTYAVHKTATQTLTNKTVGDQVDFTQVSTPSNPLAGVTRVYSKTTDGQLYYKNGTSGAETLIGGTAVNYARSFLLMGG